MRIANRTGQHQELHYFDNTVVIEPGEDHTVDLKRIGNAELTRVVNVFTEVKEEMKPAPSITKPQAQQKKEIE